MLLSKQTVFNQPWQRVIFLFVLLLSLFGISPPTLTAETDQQLVLKEDGHLRARPDDTNKITHFIRKGTQVIRKGQQPGWAHVFVPAIHGSGWIPNDLLNAKSSIPTLPPKNLKKSLRETSSSQPKKTQASNLKKLTKQPTSSIAVLDVQKIIDNSQRGKEAFLDFKKLSSKKNPEELARAEQEALTRIIMEIRMLVELYATEHHLTHIINKNSASLFLYDPRFDITDDILQIYDRQAGDQQ
ncbi:MAG: OmpH family outer membrane protein [Thermodesulfobacteriota bacterium]|nr:OmpH family outer membrane protein [Thermodesulfobacteriota bacterium]